MGVEDLWSLGTKSVASDAPDNSVRGAGSGIEGVARRKVAEDCEAGEVLKVLVVVFNVYAWSGPENPARYILFCQNAGVARWDG